MRRFLLFVVTLLLTAAGFTQSSKSSALVIDDVTLIDVTGAPPQPHRTVVVSNSEIEKIVAAASATAKLPGTHVDGSGKFLIPGLWDMHVHMVFGDWFPPGNR